MGFRSRKDKDITPKEFVEGANKTEEEMESQKVKNFNLRLSQEELDLLKKEASKNRRSMQQHIKHLLWNSCESQKELEQI